MSRSATGADLHLTVAIATFRRVERLLALLPVAVEQVQAAIDAGLISAGQVLVVDNDPTGSALRALETADRGDSSIPLVTMHETRPGIAAARNRLLAEAGDTRLLAFLDDDETPRPGWLIALLRTWRDADADAVAGPVLPVYEGDVPDWVAEGPFHDSGVAGSGTAMDYAASGNLLLDLDVVRRAGLSFSEGLGTRGGEDTAFTMGFVRAGGRIVWCEEAVVDEAVPAPRTTPRAILERSAAVAAGHSSIKLRMYTTHRQVTRQRLRLTCEGMARVAVGAVGAAWGTLRRSPAQTGLGLHRVARGGGFVLGAWGLIHDSYGRGGARRWQRDR